MEERKRVNAVSISNRKEYIDVLKFIGIFSIYLGHFGEGAGKFYPFVFAYHVPLFFFLSGCMERIATKRKFVDYFLNKVKTILIPWLLFALASVVIVVANENHSMAQIRIWLMQILQGCVRNVFFSGSLWFLPCLFVISMMFYGITRVVKKKSIIFVICLSVYIASQRLLPHKPQSYPAWYWNVDSAMYYLLYYCIGYLLFPYMDKVLCAKKKSAKWFVITVSMVSGLYAAMCFMGNDCLMAIWTIPEIGDLFDVTKAMIMFPFLIGMAYVFRDVQLFQNIGRNTLYLCGNEYIIKTFMIYFLGIFGISIQVVYPLAAILYTLFLLCISNRLLVPAEKYILNKILYFNQEN